MPVALAATFMLASPALFGAAAALALVAVAVGVVRRVALPRGTIMLMTLALACVCLAAGGLTWQRRAGGHVAVVVDVSPSMRSAAYQDRAKLAARVDQLLGRTPYTLYELADGVRRAPSQAPSQLTRRVDSHQTTYAPPPDADAVVLFSDARFSTTNPTTERTIAATPAATPAAAAPQTFVVLDPALDNPPDVAIERLGIRGDTIVVTLFNGGGGRPRKMTISGTDVRDVPVDIPGRFVVTGKITPGAREAIAYVGPFDSWMGNDSLEIRVPPPATAEKWWVGAGPARAPAADWVRVDPGALPVNVLDYLAAGVIVLDNVPADLIPETPRARLHQYVRDLGGGMVILGGDNAFAAGGYAGTPIDDISPLASTPPRPAAQWLLLADSSGSMARTLGDNSRWHFAVHAIGQIIPRLPPDDTISIGNFSQALRWWTAGKSVREAQAGFASPKDLRPHGPTNLAAALRLIAETTDGTLPTQLMLITDAEAKIDNAAALADALAAKKVTVSVLATEAIAPTDPLAVIATRTGGRVVGQSDPRKWARELKQLMRAASVPWLEREPLLVRPTDAGPRFSPQRVAPWNRTWLKRDATELASGVTARATTATTGAATTGAAGERVPAIAAWHVGTGAVISAAFAPSPAIVEDLVERVAAPPRDPRFRVIHDAARELRVTLKAIDNSGAGGAGGSSDGGTAAGYMNGLAPRLELSADATRASDAIPMPQSGPGRYEVILPAPLRPVIATVRLNGRVVDRFAVSGRYPPEYEKIGNDRAAMESLARATGGAIIDPAHTAPLDFRWPTRSVLLAPYLAAAAAVLMAGALVRWRMS